MTLPDPPLAAMRGALRGGLPRRTLFRERPRRGFLPSALGAGLFLLVAGGFWLAIEAWDAGARPGGAAQAHRAGPGPHAPGSADMAG
ncbi:MAG: hypothetical protein GC153_01935 [Alphaproteobacteria bacterium]|nr:hypothetical protein [Alphaproteobacteria bacterium]